MNIFWERRRLDEIIDKEKPSLFMFSRNKSVTYIGVAYNTGLKAEINYSIKRLKFDRIGLSIWTTIISESSFKHISEKLYFGTECLLVFMHQTNEDSDCYENYIIHVHRDDFKIFNEDCSLLLDGVKVVISKFYHS